MDLLERSLISTDLNGPANTLDQLVVSPRLELDWGTCSHLVGVMRSKRMLYLEIPLNHFSFYINGHLLSNATTPLTMVLTTQDSITFSSIKEAYESIRLAMDPVQFMFLYQKLRGVEIDLSRATPFLEFRDLESKSKLLKLLLPITKPLSEGDIKMKYADLSQLSEEIFETLIMGLSDDYIHAERTYCNTLAIRAHELIFTTPHEKLSISQVCDKLNASSRSLQKGLKDVYGMGFIELHRLYRLNKVRDYIHGKGMKSGELADIMWMFGFTHGGRFAQDYKKAFGITPSRENRVTNDN